MKKILNISFLGIFLLAIAALYFFGQNQSPNTSTSVPTPTPITTNPQFISYTCGFSLETPPGWQVKDSATPLTGTYDDLCTILSAPDYKVVPGQDVAEGLVLRIHRTPIGFTFITVPITDAISYIQSVELVEKPKMPGKDVEDKMYGNLSGKYFEYTLHENTAHFVFVHDKYLYAVKWNADYAGDFKSDIEPILRSVVFNN